MTVGPAPTREESAPRVPTAHLLTTETARLLFAVDTGRLYAIEEDLYEALAASARFGDDRRTRLLMAGAGLPVLPRSTTPPAALASVRAISLAIASTCNLGCVYCYASEGSFGGSQTPMPDYVARRSIDLLLAGAQPGEAVRIIFLGGEPLSNRAGLRAATLYAREKAREARVAVEFALTTNATLLTEEDAAFLDEHAFAVTISIDGLGVANDGQRPFKNGRGSFERVIERALALLDRPNRRATVAARASVTPLNLALRETLKGLVALGFNSVQFSPVLSSPTGSGEMASSDLGIMLAEMIACGAYFEEQFRRGTAVPFANMIGTLKRIHAQIPDEYPCGAGGSYAAVGSGGDVFACHRFVGDERARLGDAAHGVTSEAQNAWLAARNVRRQTPCSECWARHMCGGGCHYEALTRGRMACDFIRGWIHYCLGVYARLIEACPARLAGL